MITLTFKKGHAVLSADCKSKLRCRETCYEAIGIIQTRDDGCSDHGGTSGGTRRGGRDPEYILGTSKFVP